MQDRYSGDVGDFGKLALLRALAPGRRVGVCWYRTDGAGESNNDGRHLAYLERPERFRDLDAELFDAMLAFAAEFRAEACQRCVASLEALGLLPAGTVYHGEICPRSSSSRQAWAARMVAAMEGADFLFLDPDNGLEAKELSPKSTAVAELQALRRPGRPLLLYHHQTRRPGGAAVEAAHVGQRLRDAGFSSVDVVRLRPYSSRFYFLVDGDPTLRRRLGVFAEQWGRRAELFQAHR